MSSKPYNWLFTILKTYYLIDIIYTKRYDYIFFLPGKLTKEKTGINDIIKDGTRYQSEEELNVLDQHMELMFTKVLKANNIFKLDCPLENRMEEVLKIIVREKA